MTESTRNTIVGATCLMGLVGLCTTLFLFGYQPAFLRGGYIVEARMDDGLSLGAGSPVTISGIDIGKVEDVRFEGVPGGPVLVTSRIREDIRLPVGTVAEVDTDLLGGIATLRLVAPAGAPLTEVATLPTNGTARIDGKLGSLAGAFRSLDGLSASIDDLSTTWAGVGEQVSQVLGGDGTQETSIVEVVRGLNGRLAEAQAVIADVRSYTNDAVLRERVMATLANAEATTADTRAAAAQVRSVVDGAGEKVEALTSRYLATAEEAISTLSQIQEAMVEATDGEGTIALLLNDPAFFNNWAGTAERIGAAADEGRLLVQKWRDEGFPLRF